MSHPIVPRKHAGSPSKQRKTPPRCSGSEDLAKNLAINAFVDDIFSAAYDLVIGNHMNPATALRALKEAVGHPSEPC
ncbi:MAG: hypothetical protein JOZ19_01840 [Rubrobacter sp.]|nr:hypothetical protein [Rubrobacter sp.]